jgi:hypothetical protein
MRLESLASVVVSASLFAVGVIHLLPLSGVLGAERLTVLYGIDFSDANLSILMRHRAVLFGLLGAFMIVASFKPSLRTTALVAGVVSVASFIAIAGLHDHYNDAIRRVVNVDWFALAVLTAGALAHAYKLTRH